MISKLTSVFLDPIQTNEGGSKVKFRTVYQSRDYLLHIVCDTYLTGTKVGPLRTMITYKTKSV